MNHFLRCAALALILGACPAIQRNAPAPVVTAQLETVSDEAADTLLVDLERVDSTLVIEMRYATANNFTGAPLPGYEGNKAYLRAEAAAALSLVSEDLRRQGYKLKILDAYRPVRASEAMVAWAARTGRNDLLRDGYIAARSFHNVGTAIDLTLLVASNGSEVNMGTPYDHFSRQAHTRNAQGQIARNRQLLKTTMERQGFVNYDKEWWHFSYAVRNPVRFDRVVR